MSTFEQTQGGRPVLKNAGPVLMSPGGTLNFNVPQTPKGQAAAVAADGGSAGGIHEGFSVCSPGQKKKDNDKGKIKGHTLSRAPVLRELFGGAITLQLPETYEDVSMLREVPDHQEVFVDRDSDASLIVELLEHDGSVSDDHAPAHYFRDLAACNDAEGSSVLDFGGVVAHAAFVPLVKVDPKRCVKCAAVGRQRITKFRSVPPARAGAGAGAGAATGDDVAIVMCVVRLLDVLTDVLITLNVPVASDGWDAFPVVPSAATKLPAPAAAAASGGGTSSRPESARARADAARADVRAEATTVASLLYKEPTVAMLLKATTIDGAAASGGATEAAPAGGTSGHGTSGNGQEVLTIGRSLKAFHGLFARPELPTGSDSHGRHVGGGGGGGNDDQAPPAEAEQLPMSPHAVIKAAIESFTIVNWQLFA